MIHISNITKQFGDNTVVSIPELSIQQGEIIGLVGNNGAGKSTLFRMMLDLVPPTSGEILYSFPISKEQQCIVSKINPNNSEDWKNHVGAFIDNSFLIEYLTPAEYFNFIGQVFRIPHNEIHERTKQLCHFLDFEDFNNKLIRDLSAGNKQKTGIIGAFLPHPDLIILDEPFNFLDPTSQNHLKRMIKTLNSETNATIIVSSHNLEHTTGAAKRILLMEKGMIIKDLDSSKEQTVAELKSYFEI